MFFSQDMFSGNMLSLYFPSFSGTQLDELNTKYNTSLPALQNPNSIFTSNPFLSNSNLGAQYNSMFPGGFSNPNEDFMSSFLDFNNTFSDFSSNPFFNTSAPRSSSVLGSYAIPSEYSVSTANFSNEVVYRDQSTTGGNVVKNAFQFYGLAEKASGNPESLEYGDNLANKFFGFNNPGAHWCSAFATYFWNQQVGYDIFGSQGYNRYNQGEFGNGSNTNGGVSTWARANNVWTNLQSSSIEEVQNTVKPGDFIIYKEGDRSNHIGIVVKIENGIAYTIEGNVDGSKIDGEYLGRVGTKKVDLNVAKQDGSVAGFVRMNEWASTQRLTA